MTSEHRKLLLMQSQDELSDVWIKTYREDSSYSSVIYYDIYKTKGINYLHNLILKEVEENKINTIIFDVSQPVVNPFELKKLQDVNSIYLVCLGIDDEYKFDWITSTYATIADLYISSDYVSVERLIQAGVNAHFLPLPVTIPSEYKSLQEEIQVSFVGQIASYKGTRQNSKDFLTQKSVPVHWYPKQNGDDFRFMPREEMNWIFKNSKIKLNFSEISSVQKNENPLFDRIRSMKLRPFEILSCGGFCLSEFSSSLSKCFEDGKEIVFYRGQEDLFKKLTYYLERPEVTRKIAEKGFDKVKDNFTDYQIRKKFKSLIDQGYSIIGKNLYNESHELVVSKSFYRSYLDMLLVTTFTNFFKLDFTIFFSELRYTLKTLTQLNRNLPLFDKISLLLGSLYRSAKTMIRKII